MFAKYYLVSYIQQLILVQTVFSDCWRGRELSSNMRQGAACDGPIRYDSIADWVVSGIYPEKLTTVKFSPTFSGVLSVKSRSALHPTGISVVSNNAFEGLVKVAGELPFVGTSTVKGLTPSIGNGAINHSCGNGFNALTSLTLLSSPDTHTASEYVNPCIAPAFEPVLVEPDTSFAASVSLTPAISIDNPDIAIPYATAAFQPDLSVFSCNILLDPAISAGSFEYMAPYNIPHQESHLSQSSLPSSGCVSSQSSVGTPYISYCEEGLTNVPYDIEFTVTDRGNLPLTSVLQCLHRDISLSSTTGYEGLLQISGEIPFINSVVGEDISPITEYGDFNEFCNNDIITIVNGEASFVPRYGGVTYAPRYGLRPEATDSPGYDYCCDDVLTDYGCGH